MPQPRGALLRRPAVAGGRVLALVLCFGALGLVLASPPLRRRSEERAGRCGTCRRHRTVRRALVAGLTGLLLLGVGIRAQEVTAPKPACGTIVYGGIRFRTSPPVRVPLAPAWARTRQIVTAPATGLGLTVADASGMTVCAASPMDVALRPPPRASSGGTTVGDLFMAWFATPAAEAQAAARNVQGLGVDEPVYVRIGLELASEQRRMALARHESRHVDQWAVFTLAAGPLAFPALYAADSMFFPFSRNHFERDAGLEAGDYPIPASYGPAPLWPVVAVLAAVLLLAFRRRLRWLSRLLTGGRRAAGSHLPDRCPVHSPGWRGEPSAPRRREGPVGRRGYRGGVSGANRPAGAHPPDSVRKKHW
jgi:hypothetical protein